MRAFVAIKLDMKVINDLRKIQQELKSRIKGIRWVKPELLHITLKFLGEIKEEDIAPLEQRLEELGNRTAPFNLSFSSLGAFPHQGDPRIIWIGVNEGAGELYALAREIDKLLLTHKIYNKPDKSKFKPHLTLGRRNKHEELYLPCRVFEERLVCNSIMNVKEFYLLQSTLYRSGPVYAPLKKFLLKNFN
ncbi:MAG: RNA 2',3'-cyclic phosphodiesterase [Dethiobacteria bacterium]|jgi:2'-5' RNA ligase